MRKGEMRKEAIFLAAMAALTFNSGVVQARSSDSAQADRAFVREAIQSDLAEVQVGKLAQEKGVSEKVKQFGQRLQDDHGASLEKARSLAESMNITLPT